VGLLWLKADKGASTAKKTSRQDAVPMLARPAPHLKPQHDRQNPIAEHGRRPLA
jgi:hypothetical protein